MKMIRPIKTPRRKKTTKKSKTSFRSESFSSFWSRRGAMRASYRAFFGMNCAFAIDTTVFLIFITLIGKFTAKRWKDVNSCSIFNKGHIYESIPLRKKPTTNETTNWTVSKSSIVLAVASSFLSSSFEATYCGMSISKTTLFELSIFLSLRPYVLSTGSGVRTYSSSREILTLSGSFPWDTSNG